MDIIEVSYKWNGGFSTRPRTDFIALHHAEAATCTAADIHRWHLNNGWTGIGYHFFVRKDGTIYRGRPLNVMGAHVEGKNNCSIGICAEGAYHNKDKTMPQAQFNAIVELCKYLKSNYYPNAKIVGHREIGSSDCPGKYYPLEKIKQAVANNVVFPTVTDKYENALFKLKDKGYITDISQWRTYADCLKKSLAVALVDNVGGGTWQSDRADRNIHWAQPFVLSLAAKDGGDPEGTKIITDVEGWVATLESNISKAQALALVDKTAGGTLNQYKRRQSDHWGRNCLDSLCDKGIVNGDMVKYWRDDFEDTVTKGEFLLLCYKAFC